MKIGIVTNNGNVITYPIITLKGAITNPTITNTTINPITSVITTQTIRLNVNLNDGDTLIIDNTPQNRGIYLNNVANMSLKTSVGWINCPAGDNTFSLTRTSSESGTNHCSVSLQSRWI